MKRRVLFAAAAAAFLIPLTAEAGSMTGSVERGAREGARVGNKAAGPIGAGVGTVMGGTAYGFRHGASKVLGVPEETGSVKRSPLRRKPVDER